MPEYHEDYLTEADERAAMERRVLAEPVPWSGRAVELLRERHDGYAHYYDAWKDWIQATCDDFVCGEDAQKWLDDAPPWVEGWLMREMDDLARGVFRRPAPGGDPAEWRRHLAYLEGECARLRAALEGRDE